MRLESIQREITVDLSEEADDPKPSCGPESSYVDEAAEAVAELEAVSAAVAIVSMSDDVDSADHHHFQQQSQQQQFSHSPGTNLRPSPRSVPAGVGIVI